MEAALFESITDLASGLAKKEFSSRELTLAYLDRLRRFGPRYNALAHLIEGPALRQADQADTLFRAGRIESPLQGIPCGVKDLLATKDTPTSWGAEPYRRQQFDYDATVIRKLAAAGAVLIGKLAMVELAGAGGYRYAAASMHGPGLNPWNTDHWSGGSSSGPSSAVAAGLVPFAIGSETWGSITTPSSYCGITGLRPTYGLVSRHGAMPLSWTMDKLGPMCRSAVDCALVLEAIAGNDPQDPSSAARGFHHRSEAKSSLDTLRVGFSDIDFRHWAHPASRPGFQDALDVFREMKLRFKPISLPEMPYGDAAEIIISAEGSSVFEPLIRSDKLETLADERQKAGLRAGLAIPASEYLRAMRIRRIVQEKLRRLFAHVDLIVSPTTPETASRLDEPLDAGRPLKLPDGERGNIDLSAATNLAGLPALSLPCGFGASRLPIGIQLVAHPHEEHALLRIGEEFQKRTDWHRRKPPI